MMSFEQYYYLMADKKADVDQSDSCSSSHESMSYSASYDVK